MHGCGIDAADARNAFRKVKAHRSRTQAATSGEPMRHWLGNGVVDRLAKRGCRLRGGRKTIDEAAERVTAARERHKVMLQALAAGIAAWFATEGKKPKPRTTDAVVTGARS